MSNLYLRTADDLKTIMGGVVGLLGRDAQRRQKADLDNIAVSLEEDHRKWYEQNVLNYNQESEYADSPTAYWDNVPRQYEGWIKERYDEHVSKLTDPGARESADLYYRDWLTKKAGALAIDARAQELQLSRTDLDNNVLKAKELGDRNLLNLVTTNVDPMVADATTVQRKRDAAAYEIALGEYRRTAMTLPTSEALKLLDPTKQLRYFTLEGEERYFSASDVAKLRGEVEAVKDQQGKQVYADLQKRISEGNWKDITRQELIAARDNVDAGHRNDVTALLEDYDKVHNLTPEQMVESDKRRTALTMQSQLARWDGTGTAPFTDQQVIDLASPPAGTSPRLSKEDAAGLMADLAAKLAKTGGAIDPRDTFAATRLGLMTNALAQADPTDPGLAVKDGQLERDLENGDIKLDDYERLVSRRLELMNQFREGSTVGKSTAEGEAAAFDIVYNRGLNVDQRREALVEVKGLSGADRSAWLNRINFAAGDARREAIFGALDGYYRTALALIPPDKKADRQKMTLEMYDAMRAMEAYMIANPDDVKGAEDKLHQFQGEQAQRDIVALLSGTRVPGTPARPDIATARQYETVREQFAAEFAENPVVVAEFESKYRPIAVSEEKVELGRRGITPVSSYRNGRGDETYKDRSGAEYVVLQRLDGNVYREKVFRVVYREVVAADGTRRRQMGYEPL